MSDSQGQSWSSNFNAPKIPYDVYLREKAWFGGNLVSAVLYGTCKRSPSSRPPIPAHYFALLVYCRDARRAVLFNPIYRRGEGIKWGLVSFTAIMFSLVTVHLATNLQQLSISYIDNRDFAGPVYGVEIRGPYGYQAASVRKVTYKLT